MTFRPSIVVAAGDVAAGSVVAVAVSGVAVAVAVVSVTPILKPSRQSGCPLRSSRCAVQCLLLMCNNNHSNTSSNGNSSSSSSNNNCKGSRAFLAFKIPFRKWKTKQKQNAPLRASTSNSNSQPNQLEQ